jgi:hypothetical protein
VGVGVVEQVPMSVTTDVWPLSVRVKVVVKVWTFTSVQTRRSARPGAVSPRKSVSEMNGVHQMIPLGVDGSPMMATCSNPEAPRLKTMTLMAKPTTGSKPT